MRNGLTGALLVLLSLQPLQADEYETLFYQGNQYYDNGDYAAAAETYEKIVQAGRGNGSFFTIWAMPISGSMKSAGPFFVTKRRCGSIRIMRTSGLISTMPT
ncbi:MAG: tetratricopeptide repeat protein [candidate division KSB1 bacterium]|nr:tetratricopeptide repeat protein [candidate division KSB1 bacterium]